MSVKSFITFVKYHLQEASAGVSPAKAAPQETVDLLSSLLKPYQGKKGQRLRALRYAPAKGKAVEAAPEK